MCLESYCTSCLCINVYTVCLCVGMHTELVDKICIHMYYGSLSYCVYVCMLCVWHICNAGHLCMWTVLYVWVCMFVHMHLVEQGSVLGLDRKTLTLSLFFK